MASKKKQSKKAKTEKEFKSPSAIIRAAKKLLSDPVNWTMGAFNKCLIIPKFADEEEIEKWLKMEIPLVSPKEAKEHNEECLFCILGAIGHYDAGFTENFYEDSNNEDTVIDRPAGHLVELAARELYGKEGELDDFLRNPLVANGSSVAVSVNDGVRHKTPKGSYKAVLRILDRALELSKAKKA